MLRRVRNCRFIIIIIIITIMYRTDKSAYATCIKIQRLHEYYTDAKVLHDSRVQYLTAILSVPVQLTD